MLSELLFHMYSECIFGEALENINAGISLNGEIINNIRYAEDTVIFADSMERFQQLMSRITACSQAYGLDTNTKKTKLIIVSKEKMENCQLTINQELIEQVNSYTYLGTVVNDQ